MSENIPVTPNSPKAAFGPNYILFCISRLISELGTVIFRFTIGLYLLDATGSASLFASVISLSLIPGIVVNMFGGVLIDRGNKKKIVIMTDIISGCVVLLFAFLFKLGSNGATMLAAVTIILSSIQAVFSLAITASIPNIAEKDDIMRLNSAFQGIGAIIRIGGPIVGAFVYRIFGMNIIIFMTGIAFIISGLLEILLRYSNTNKADEKKPYKEALKDVYKYLNTQKGIKMLLAATFLSMFAFGALSNVVIQYITYNQIGLSEVQLSQIQAAGAVGMLIGAVLITFKNNSLEMFKKMLSFFQLQMGMTILWIFPMLPFFTDAKTWLTTIIFCLLYALMGIFVGFVNIPALSYIQSSTPEELRASVIGVVNILGSVAMVVGIWIYGIALEYFNWGYIVTIPTIIIIAIVALMKRTKSLKHFFNNVTW